MPDVEPADDAPVYESIHQAKAGTGSCGVPLEQPPSGWISELIELIFEFDYIFHFNKVTFFWNLVRNRFWETHKNFPTNLLKEVMIQVFIQSLGFYVWHLWKKKEKPLKNEKKKSRQVTIPWILMLLKKHS